MSLSLWSRIKKFVEKHERKAYLEKYCFDTKCPCCDKWQGNCGGVIGHQESYPDDAHDAYRCGNCRRWFIMDARGMISIPAQDQSAARALDNMEYNNVSSATVPEQLAC